MFNLISMNHFVGQIKDIHNTLMKDLASKYLVGKHLQHFRAKSYGYLKTRGREMLNKADDILMALTTHPEGYLSAGNYRILKELLNGVHTDISVLQEIETAEIDIRDLQEEIRQLEGSVFFVIQVSNMTKLFKVIFCQLTRHPFLNSKISVYFFLLDYKIGPFVF